MQTTVNEIREWLEEGKKQNATHMIVACDTFDWEDYPVYVLAGKVNVHLEGLYSQPMTQVMEIYSYDKDIEKQLLEKRAWNI